MEDKHLDNELYMEECEIKILTNDEENNPMPRKGTLCGFACGGGKFCGISCL